MPRFTHEGYPNCSKSVSSNQLPNNSEQLNHSRPHCQVAPIRSNADVRQERWKNPLWSYGTTSLEEIFSDLKCWSTWALQQGRDAKYTSRSVGFHTCKYRTPTLHLVDVFSHYRLI